jgi:Cu-processing system permease protein
VILSEYTGTACSLVTAFLTGVGIPVLIYEPGSTGLSLVLVGTLLTLVFTSFAFLASVRSRDKARGIGIALLLWFYFTLIYDGLILLVLFSFSDYPLEKIILILLSFNPVDLGRVFIMLQMDVGALMGASGAVVQRFFMGYSGFLYTLGIMALWIIVPLLLALRSFKRKDI